MLLQLATLVRLVVEVDKVPKRFTKLLARHSLQLCTLSVYFRQGTRGHEQERLLAAATNRTPLELLEADFDVTDGSFTRAIQNHVRYVRRLRITFISNEEKKMKKSCFLNDVWVEVGSNSLEATIVTNCSEEFKSTNTLLRVFRNASVTVNNHRLR